MIREDLTYALAAGKPMLIEPLKAKAFLANANLILSNPDLAYLLSQKVAGENYKNRDFKGARADDEVEQPLAADSSISKSTAPYVDEGIGIIPVNGVIGKGLSALESMLGCADIDIIGRTLKEWETRDDVFEVVFNVDSGGGSTSGVEEMAKRIREYPKPTISFTESDCGSAAFWLASQAKRFVCTPSASVGACGVYVTINDDFDKYAKEGRKVVVIKSGQYKAAGVEGTRLSKAQEEQLQEEVDELHRRFIRDVLAVRQFAKMEDLQGQSFYGDIAAVRGLTTGVTDSFDDLLKDIRDTRKYSISSTYGTQSSTYRPSFG